MATETIVIDGEEVTTLREMLKPGLKCVVVGLNPSPVSVAAGHYYQGQIGRGMWRRMTKHRILTGLIDGEEDDIAFTQGFGFADLVRRPTPRAIGLTALEIKAAGPDLLERLAIVGDPKPLILFVFAQAALAARSILVENGYRCLQLPAPFAKREIAEAQMKRLRAAISRST